jgi:hypothetical protein
VCCAADTLFHLVIAASLDLDTVAVEGKRRRRRRETGREESEERRCHVSFPHSS